MFRLEEIALFAGLNERQMAQLQAGLLVKHYTKGSIIFYEGDKSEYLHLLIEGCVRLYKTSATGKEVYMHGISTPSVIALYPALEKVSFPATCAFLTEGTIGLIPLSKFHDYLKDLDFSLAIIKTMSKRMKLLENLLHKETMFSSEAKIADLIYGNGSIFERLKNNEIAFMLNITPETLSRTLTKLKKEKIITLTHNKLSICNAKALYLIIETNSMKKNVT